MAGRVGSRAPMILGGLIGAVGYGLLSRLGARSTLIEMLPGFILIPAGMGLAVPSNDHGDLIKRRSWEVGHRLGGAEHGPTGRRRNWRRSVW